MKVLVRPSSSSASSASPRESISVTSLTESSLTSLILRSIALFTILFQLRLIAGDLCDTSVFTATLITGFAGAAFLSLLRQDGRQVAAITALVSIALVPWVCRTLIAAPRLFIPNRTDQGAILLDSLLLHMDRNNFVSLFPFYWSAVSTWFSIHSRKFLRAAVVTDAALLIVLYSIARTVKIELYRWPIVMIVVFALIVFLQALALLFSNDAYASKPNNTRLRIKEICAAVIMILAIIITGGFLFLKPIQQQAVEMGGGLLEPKFFSFDFSKYLKLDPEISTKNDLIMIVKKEDDNNVLLRRTILSGYAKKQGFYKIEELDEKAHPSRLPMGQVVFEREFSSTEKLALKLSPQEYFLINIESTAFIGMKEPVKVTPFQSWDTSSFKSAYAVESMVMDMSFWDVARAIAGQKWPQADALGLSEDEFKIYTEYGNDGQIKALAEEITDGLTLYSNKVAAVLNYLKYGDYRYSLKPGIAPDGDQLGWFLFKSKKGYCSYYAFAMTVLLRSLDIPARVAAGFFVEPETNTFDYYPVRSDMAHAWVEVAFPGYGWLEFDPTTEKLAEDEEFRFAPGTDPALFERLMREILENRSRLQKKEGADEAQITSNLNSIARFAITSLKNNWLPLLAAALVLIFVYIRFGLFISVFLTGNYRKKSIRLMKHTWRRLKLSGRAKESGLLSEPELALKLDSQYPGIYSMYRGSAAARFAPEYTKEDFQTQWENYKKLKINKRKSLLRTKGSIVLCSLLFALSQTSAQVPPDDTAYQTPDALYNAASEADFSENWERAIQLYKEGSSRFPGDDRFSWALGNLYYSRYLYGMAWDEYRKTEAISPENPGILIRLARTAGYLNRNTVAVEYYKKVLDIDPDNKEAIGSLGWMYFKVHRLADGEKLLVSALDRFGDDPDFSMTLGTVYSDMYRYDDSKRWYTKAIELGEIIEDRVFTSIAWYNLSILESRFYNYELCMEATNSSLNIQNRASGRLARGELLKRRLELESSQKEHQTAYEIDTSPLAKINLAQIYQISGRLVEAQAYAEDCLKGGDNSWMVNFGIDPDRYKRDIHHILANTYNGLLKTEKLTPRSKTGEKIQALFKKASYKLKYEVNIRLFRKYCLAAANAYVEYGSEGWADGGSHLDAYIQYYNAFNDYPRRALAYLNMARRFETALMPAAVPSYDMDEGYTLIKLDKRSAGRLLDDAIDSLDPVWEREQIARCIRAFANPKNRRLTSSNYTKQEAAEELFAMNRGILRQMGIKLPVYINTFSEDASAGKILEKAVLLGAFKKTDWYARYRLYIRINGSQASSPPEPSYSASFELVDSKGEIDNILFSTQIRDPGKNEYYDISRNFGNLVFTVE